VVGYQWSFGDGTIATGANVTHTYAQDGVYTVSLVVTDNDGLTDTLFTTAAVANVAPVVGAFNGATLLPGEAYAASGSFTDPGADPWTATVNYGDGSGVSALALSGMTFNLSHTYTAVGVFTVTVRISDDDVTSAATQTVTVISQAQGARNAIPLVDQLAAAGKITQNVALGLRFELQQAVTALDAGMPVLASTVLGGVVTELDILVQIHHLSAADAAPLRTLVTRVIRSIGAPRTGRP
jgi:PKD repeat protein